MDETQKEKGAEWSPEIAAKKAWREEQGYD